MLQERRPQQRVYFLAAKSLANVSIGFPKQQEPVFFRADRVHSRAKGLEEVDISTLCHE
jgi:hypothetical protein